MNSNELSQGKLTVLSAINEIACYLEDTNWLDRDKIYITAVKIYEIDQKNYLMDSILAKLEDLVDVAEDFQDNLIKKPE